MRNKKKKSPKDYKSFSFRCDEETKEVFSKDIETVRVALNTKKGSEEKIWRKNDVIIKSLELGLRQLSSRTKKSRE